MNKAKGKANYGFDASEHYAQQYVWRLFVPLPFLLQIKPESVDAMLRDCDYNHNHNGFD